MSLLLNYCRGNLKQFIIGPAFKLFEAILELNLPIFMANIIDKGIAGGDVSAVYRYSLYSLAVSVAGYLCALVCQYSAAVAAAGVGTRMRSAVFAKIMRMPFRDQDRFGAQTLTTRVTNDVNQIQQAVAITIRLSVRAPYIAIGSIICAVMLDFSLSMVLMLAVPMFIAAMAVIMTRTPKLYRAVQKKLDAVGTVVRENLSGVRVIRAFAREDAERARFGEKNGEWFASGVRVAKIAAALGPVTALIINAAIVGIIWFGGVRVNLGDISQGQVLAFINYLTQVLATLVVITSLMSTYTRAYASYGRISEVLAAPEGNGALPVGDNTEPAIVFEKVCFGYTSAENAIENATFSLRRGQTLGVIGGTGSGKSTLAHLLMGLLTPSSGVARVSASEKSIVLQRCELFTGTVAENIRWGHPGACEEDVIRAAKAAQAHEFIERLTGGYNAPLGRGGLSLSGGQRQRLSIARALVRRPDLLILDDSSSALDYATEARLYDAIRREYAGMTLVIVSQRASSVKKAERILMLDDGAILDQGTHEELAARCDAYREIQRLQMGGGAA